MSNVPYTCYLIDAVIEVLKELEVIPGLGDGDDFKDLTVTEAWDIVAAVEEFDLDDIKDALEKLEEIRGHNETLREESEGFESDKDGLESRVSELEDELSDVRGELEKARDEIRKLEKELENE